MTRELTARVTAVDNIGSPSVLLVTAEVRQVVLGTARTFSVQLPVTEAEFTPGLWPPQRGDEFPVGFSPADAKRPD